MTRAKLSIPFIGKDVPSPSSEFAHPVPRRSKENDKTSGFDMSMTVNSINRNETCCCFLFQGALVTENVKGNLLLMSEDITIGLTLLSLRYEGLRMSDYEAGQKHQKMKRFVFQRIGADFAAFAISLR